jgi:Holliday junction resolvasome RuvABC DNA-binding subunit
MLPHRHTRRRAPAPRERIAWAPSANPAVTAALLSVVDQQLRDNTPPETRRTFERLVALGYAPEDARRLIGSVVAQEIFAVMQREETYNEQRYIAALQGLPDSAV